MSHETTRATPRPKAMDAYDREQRQQAINKKRGRTAERARRLKRGVIHAKVGTMPGEYLKIQPGAWSFSPEVGDRFTALHSDSAGNYTQHGEKLQRYLVCEIKRIDGEHLYYLEASW